MERKSVRDAERGGLGEVLASPAFARLVLHFAVHGEEWEHVRALQRRCRLSMSSVHRELQRLERRGLVERSEDGVRVLYRAAQAHPGWKGLRQMVRDFADPVEVVEEAIASVTGIEAAFVFGSFARGDPRADSDVDVLVVGDRAAEARLGREAAVASMLLGRPVEIRSYTREKLERQLGAGSAVLRRILAGPKRWIVGDKDWLPAAAA
ncbi:MAG TPA: nucleotidyltransferase domain-containing protein [Longimicrobiaceae bacterium]|nr:nucleotidyltransferase domain-containing protein [Longimicrobiaceae bacterium]